MQRAVIQDSLERTAIGKERDVAVESSDKISGKKMSAP